MPKKQLQEVLMDSELFKKFNNILKEYNGLRSDNLPTKEVTLGYLLDEKYPEDELKGKIAMFARELGRNFERQGIRSDVLKEILMLKSKKGGFNEIKMGYIRDVIRGKKIRIFVDIDWDGAVAGAIVRLYSGAECVDVIAAGANYDINGKFTGGGKKEGIIDVSVDTREKEGREDIRIDHHGSKSDENYRDRLTFLIDPEARSTAGLVAKIFNARVDPEIIREIDDLDRPIKRISVWASHFVNTGFMKDHGTLGPAAAAKALTKVDFSNAKRFHEAMMPFLQEGFNIATLGGKYGEHEEMLEKKFKIRFIKTDKVIIAYSDDSFTLPVKEFGNAMYYFKPVYYGNEAELPAYHLYAFYPSGRSKEEPFELFVGRNAADDVVNIGDILNKAKEKFGEFNGGGGADVGGANFPPEPGIKEPRKKLVYQFILKNIAEHYGVLDKIKGIRWLGGKGEAKAIAITEFHADVGDEFAGTYWIDLKIKGTINGNQFAFKTTWKTPMPQQLLCSEDFENEKELIEFICHNHNFEDFEVEGELKDISLQERAKAVEKAFYTLKEDVKWSKAFRQFFIDCNKMYEEVSSLDYEDSYAPPDDDEFS